MVEKPVIKSESNDSPLVLDHVAAGVLLLSFKAVLLSRVRVLFYLHFILSVRVQYGLFFPSGLQLALASDISFNFIEILYTEVVTKKHIVSWPT